MGVMQLLALSGVREGAGLLQVTSKGLLLRLVYSRCVTCVRLFMLCLSVFVLLCVLIQGEEERLSRQVSS